MYGEPKSREFDKEKEELRSELEKLQRKVERLTKENKDLSEKLKDTGNFLESKFTELEEINKRRNNQVKEFKDSLLEKSFEGKRCEEALLKKKKEEVGFVQQTIEHVISKVRESAKGSEEIRGNDKKVILQIIQKIESVLEEEVAQYLPNEVSYAEFDDRGYDSGRSTTASQLYNTIVKCPDDNRELKEVYDESNNMRTRHTRFE
ncbi:coiled-coil domain-containing protein [Wolbachia endosymbiont of Tettigetta isshikii]|uniref:hypothetical protein n=1 Tax=Wolbachia endosymbiont of Tettigetta isshikii TaxID=3239093 RepID=UPI00397F9D4F